MFEKKKEKEKELAEPKAKPAAAAAAAAAAADAILEAMGDGLVLCSMDGKVISVNPALERMLGIKRGELVGKDVADLVLKIIKPEDIEGFRGVFGTALEGKVPVPKTLTIVTKDGRETPISITVSFIKDLEGKPTSVVVTAKDITELKRAEVERVASFRRATDIMESIGDPVFLVDTEGRTIQVNRAATETFGYTVDELVGRSPLHCMAKEDHPNFEKYIREMVEKGTASYECTGVRKDKTTFPVLAKGTVLRDAKGNLVCIIGTLRDITELKRAEEERVKAVSAAAAVADKARAEEAEKFTKELQAKVKDLEDFRRLAVGRELKMKKMEEEMEELKKKLRTKG